MRHPPPAHGRADVPADAGRDRRDDAGAEPIVSAAWLASACAFAVAISATPGPNNAMVTASGATWGFRRTIPHLCGIAIGFPVMVIAVALGAGEVLRVFPWTYAALRWLGAAYLLWLAWQIATAEPKAEGAPAGRSRPLGFARAALFQWVNPKAWLAAVGAVVTYTTAGAAMPLQVGLLAAMFLGAALLSTTLWTAAGVGASRLLRSPKSLRWFNGGMAALLVLSLVPLLLE